MTDHTSLTNYRDPLDTQGGSAVQRNRELVRCAVLAANSHNTQPWLFDVSADRITLRTDPRRACPVVDPDNHHMFVSLGCAAENIVIAATGYGLNVVPRITQGGTVIEIDLKGGDIAPSPLIAAIPLRQSTRGAYDGSALTDAEKRALTQAATAPNVSFQLLQTTKDKAALREIVVAGNTDQMRNPAFVEELTHWLRFSPRKAGHQRDGLFGKCLGNPGLPEWLGRMIFPLVYRVGPETAKLRARIDGSSTLAVFVSHHDMPKNWIETGRAFQRFALVATSLGLLNAHINQAVEVPAQRARVANLLGLAAGRPSLVLRIGHGERLPYSYRRDIGDVLQKSE
ncbi:MAG: Tat pathway signal protein [Paracoccaceae bacterium]